MSKSVAPQAQPFRLLYSNLYVYKERNNCFCNFSPHHDYLIQYNQMDSE